VRSKLPSHRIALDVTPKAQLSSHCMQKLNTFKLSVPFVSDCDEAGSTVACRSVILLIRLPSSHVSVRREMHVTTAASALIILC